MAIHCAAAEHGGLIKKKEKKVHVSNLRPPRLTSGGLKCTFPPVPSSGRVAKQKFPKDAKAHFRAKNKTKTEKMPIIRHNVTMVLKVQFTELYQILCRTYRPVIGSLGVKIRLIILCCVSKRGRHKDNYGRQSRSHFGLCQAWKVVFQFHMPTLVHYGHDVTRRSVAMHRIATFLVVKCLRVALFSGHNVKSNMLIISLSCDRLTLSDSNLANMEPVDMANDDLIYFALRFADATAVNVILALRDIDMTSSRCP